MVNRLTITLERSECTALLEVAVAELRTPEDQIRFIVREEMQRRHLLLPPPSSSERSEELPRRVFAPPSSPSPGALPQEPAP